MGIPQLMRRANILNIGNMTISNWVHMAILLCQMAFAAWVAQARAEDPAPSAGAIRWYNSDFFSACESHCGVAAYWGGQVVTPMTRVFIRNPQFPTAWDWGNSTLAGATFSRRLLTILDVIDVEPEIGVSQRFGALNATEGWAAVYFRWVEFPWNHYVRTTVAVATGLNVASRIDRFERRISGNNRGAHTLHYFSPEITIGPPGDRRWDILFRFHHRSGVGGLMNGVVEGSQYSTVGFRYRF